MKQVSEEISTFVQISVQGRAGSKTAPAIPHFNSVRFSVNNMRFNIQNEVVVFLNRLRWGV